MKRVKTFLQVLAFFFALSIPATVHGLKIGIFHWNDINGQVQQIRSGFNASSESIPTPCSTSPVQNCEGGIENLLYHMKTKPFLPEVTKTVAISTGNLVGGENGWLSVNGWAPYGTLVGKYYGNGSITNVPDFIHTYGLKEFESGLNRTMDYHHRHNLTITLANVKCPSNLVGTFERQFCNVNEVVVDLTSDGTSRVGVVGFINQNVAKLSSPGALQFEDVVKSLQNVSSGHNNYQSLIAIGDGSLDLAKQILDSVPKVKLVIYGRGFGPSRNMSGEAYPMKYKNGWIATAGRYGTSLGKLVVDVTDAGIITNVSGDLIPTKHVDAARQTVNEVITFSNKSDEVKRRIMGQAIFQLEGGSRCWRDECNLGNLVADAMVHCAYNSSKVDTTRMTPIVGVWHGGALFNDLVKRGQIINELDLHQWLPYHNRVHLVKITGKDLKAMFTHSASGITANVNDAVKDWGQFLQVSNGLEVYYKTEGGSTRLEMIRILDEEENKPRMKDVDDDNVYNLVIPSFILEARNVYELARNWWVDGTSTDIGFDDECLKNYIVGLGKVTVGFEERIYINEWPGSGGCGSNIVKKGGNTTLTVFLTIIFMLLILGIAYVGYFYVYPKLTGRHTPNTQQFRNFQD